MHSIQETDPEETSREKKDRMGHEGDRSDIPSPGTEPHK
jgi:hypothetical protein